MVGDTRQGWALLAAMFVILVPLTVFAVWQEQSGVPAYNAMGVDQVASAAQSGGNMEGKETRFGIANSASGLPPRPALRTAASTRCTIRSRRSAGWCRCG